MNWAEEPLSRGDPVPFLPGYGDESRTRRMPCW